MVKSKSRSRKGSRRRPYIAEEKKQTQHLTSIDKLLSQPYSLPKVPDVPKIFLRRQRSTTIQRTVSIGPFTGINTNETDYALSFTLSGLPGYTEFTALFDQYCITNISLRFTPRTGPIGGFLFRPNTFFTVIDYDDDNTVTGTAMLQYQTFQAHPTDQQFERTFVPRVAIALFDTLATSGYGTKANQWVDVAYPGTKHYGLKLYIPSTTNNAIATDVMDCFATYTVSFRNPR